MREPVHIDSDEVVFVRAKRDQAIPTTRRGRPRVSIWTGADRATKLVLDDDVLAFNTNKSVSGGPGSWSITLLPGMDTGAARVQPLYTLPELYRMIDANDVVSIGYEVEGGIMAGLVDRVSRTRVVVGGQVRQTLQITGRDFGKVLANDNVVQGVLTEDDMPTFFARIRAYLGDDTPLLVSLPGVWGPQATPDDVPTFQLRTVREVVDWILDHAATMRLPLLAKVVGGTGKPGDYVHTESYITTWNDGRIPPSDLTDSGLSTYNGSVQQYIASIVDSDFYELRMDVVPGDGPLPNIVLILRPKPFDDDDLQWKSAPVEETPGTSWYELKTLVRKRQHHEIPENEVLQENLGHGDGDALSHYQVTSRFELSGNPDGLAQGLSYPLVDLWAARRYGIRTYSATLSLVGADVRRKAEGDDAYDGEVAAEVREFRNRLLGWYRFAPYFESGSIRVLLHDEYRVGDPVFLAHIEPAVGGENGTRFYCAALSTEWTFGGHATATMQLVRGYNPAMVEELKRRIAAEAPPDNPDLIAET